MSQLFCTGATWGTLILQPAIRFRSYPTGWCTVNEKHTVLCSMHRKGKSRLHAISWGSWMIRTSRIMCRELFWFIWGGSNVWNHVDWCFIQYMFVEHKAILASKCSSSHWGPCASCTVKRWNDYTSSSDRGLWKSQVFHEHPKTNLVIKNENCIAI
jgi:hypothetical protein